MRNDQIFVLLLVVLLPMSGCFDGGTAGVGEAEGAQDSGEASETTVVNNYYNNTTTSSNVQERTWYSSGEVVNLYWNDNQDIASGSSRCLEYGPSYDSSTGDYIGEECKETGYPADISDWNETTCNASGGILIPYNYFGSLNYRNAPTCSIIAASINTNSGEALIIYEMKSIVVSTTCAGIASSTTTSVTDEYRIISGSSMACVHDIAYSQTYQKSSYEDLNKQSIWSIVYAIQDTVVV